VVTQGLAVDPDGNANRYPPYLARAVHARRWAYILPYDVGAPALVALLRKHHVPYTRWHWGNASIFDGPVRPDFPILPRTSVPATPHSTVAPRSGVAASGATR
jgi:hypothetical protein